MKTVLFDTNFLLLPEMDRIDIFGELSRFIHGNYELATLSSVVDELERIKDSSSKRGTAAKVALKLIEQKKVRVYETSLPADKSIVEFSLGCRDAIVCTNDREIKRKLRKNNIAVISPKGGKYLTLV